MTERIFVQTEIDKISSLIEAEEEVYPVIGGSLYDPLHIIPGIIDSTVLFILVHFLNGITLGFSSAPIVFFYNALFLFRMIP